MKTFRCDFGNGVVCELKLPEECPANPSQCMYEVEWVGNPPMKIRRKLLRPYIAWVNTVNSTMAAQWDRKIMHVFQVSPTTGEVWDYEPGKPARRMGVVSLQKVKKTLDDVKEKGKP